MATAKPLLVSFIGKGAREKDAPRGGYRPAAYLFPPENGAPAPKPDRTSLFAGALLRRLAALGAPPDRWLVLGSAESNWDNLENALDDDALERFLGRHDPLAAEIRKIVDTGAASDDALAPWARALGDALRLDVALRVVGPCDTGESQLRLWTALEAAVRDADELAVDITHGLRHMPLLAVSMGFLLRRMGRVAGIVFYYGAFELGLKGGPCPVLKLDLPERLIRAAEALSVEQSTGSLVALPEVLPNPLRRQAAEAAFRHGIGRLGRGAARDLVKRLDRTRASDPSELAAARALRRRLDDGVPGAPYDRLLRGADRHLTDGQHLKCAIFLHEALNALALQHSPAGAGDFDERLRASRDKLLMRATPGERRSIETLRRLRNALVHGPNADRNEDMEGVLLKPETLEAELRRCRDAVSALRDAIEGRAP